MKKLILTILLLLLTGCSQNNISDKDIILGGIDKKILPIEKIQTENGELEVKNTDDNINETFIIKSDKSRYSLSNDKLDIILGITNTRDDEYGVIKLKYSQDEKIIYAGSYSTTTKTRLIENYQDVEVACPTKSTSSACYEYKLVSTTSEEIIVDRWNDINIRKSTEQASVLQKETIGKYDSNEIRYFFPKGTTFIKITLEAVSTLTFKDEFYVEVFGENGGYGMLDPLIDNIVSYWELDETTNGTRYDETDNNNDLSAVNTVEYATGKIGNATDFETNNNEYLKITDASQTGLDITGNMSLSFWVKIESAPGTNVQYGLAAKYNGGASQGSWLIRYRNASGEKMLSWNSSPNANGVGEVGVNWTTTLNAGTWYHLVFVYTAADGTVDLYINNTAQDQKTGLATSIANSSADFTIGSDAEAYNRFYDGLIDEFGIWDRTLSSAEVAALYNSGNGFAYPFSSGTTVISQESDLIVFEE